MAPPRSTIFRQPFPKSGLNGALPKVYDLNWQTYTDLSPTQIAWFQAQPEWQNFLQYVALSPKTARVGTPAAIVNSVLQAAGRSVISEPSSILKLT